MRSRTTGWALALALLGLSSLSRAEAPTTGIAADRLRFGLGASTLAGAEGAETTPSGHVTMLFGLGFLRDPITLSARAGGGRISEPVRQQLVGTLGWEIGLPRRFAIQVSLPVALWNDGDRLRFSGAPGTDATEHLASAAGDLLLGIKVALLGHPEEPGLHVALALDGTAPMGGDRQFAATGGLTIAPRIHLDYRLPFLTLVVDAQVRFQSQKTLFATTFGDELAITGGAISKLAAWRTLRLLAYLECAGSVQAAASARAVELRGALRLWHPRIQVDIGAGGGLVEAVATPRYRLFAAARVPLGRSW